MDAYMNHPCRAHLQREKQAREDAERREKELHERLQRFQDEAKAAQDGKQKTKEKIENYHVYLVKCHGV